MATLLQLASISGATVRTLAVVVDPFNASLLLADALTPLRQAMLLAQTVHETAGLRRFEERLNYTADRLTLVWPRRFPTSEAAAPYERSPEKLANHVYADRMGNGDELSGDGWKYRGRGSLMITGFDSYFACQKMTGLPLLAHPELAALIEHAFMVGAWWWRVHGCNAPADLADVRVCTRIINGGLTGIEEREQLYARACAVLGARPPATA